MNKIWDQIKNIIIFLVNIISFPLILTCLLGCIIGFVVSLITLEILSSLAFVFLGLLIFNVLEIMVNKEMRR